MDHHKRVAGRRTGSLRRRRLVLALAGLALVCAVIGALGPAEHVRTVYSWPPRDLPAAQPDRLWYAPLLIARHEPESITAQLPCPPQRVLARADRPVIVLATTREPATSGGLAVTDTGQEILVSVGEQTLSRLERAPGTPTRDCAYLLALSGGSWSLEGGPEGVSDAGTLDAMPRVDGLFSALDVQSGTRPRVEVTTTVHRTQTKTHQTVAWAVAALFALVALLLAAGAGLSRPTIGTAAGVVRRAARQARPVDAFVAVVLLVWWPIGPAFFDDGWVLARQRNFEHSGGFSTYYTSFGVNLPLDYWFEWVEHWLFQSTSAAVALRLPALLCLGATWILCRWIWRRIQPSSTGEERFALWALGCAFAVGALAWGMTLRPEPVVALLVAGVLACTVSFVVRERPAPLVIAAVLVVLALTAHPAGIVAVAPLVVVAPKLARWARARLATVAAIGLAALALLVTLATVGSDVEQRRADAVSLRTHGDETAGWRDELSRYSQLSQAPYGAPLRRESVALLLLAVLAYLLRRRRTEANALLDLPAPALGVALVLFLATPTKWPWHFGALIALGAVAVGAETARLREDARSSRGLQVRPYLVIGAAMLAGAWSWFPRLEWNELDLQTLAWTLGIEKRLTLARLVGVAPLVLLVALSILAIARRRHNLHEVPWKVAAATTPVLALPLIVFTVGVLIADTLKTNSWTFAHQNVRTLTGASRCGLANRARMADLTSMSALPAISADRVRAESESLPASPVEGLPRFSLGPAPSESIPARSPWFSLIDVKRMGFFLGGVPDPSDTLELEWGRAASGRIETLDVDDVSAEFGSDAEPELVTWRFYAAGSLPEPPPGANAVRYRFSSDVVPGTVIAVTSPVTYRNERLVEVLESDGPRALVIPNLVMYVPCARQPRLSSGVAEVPGLILALRDSLWPITADTSPFDGVLRLYAITRLPLTDSVFPPKDVVVYRVDQRIPGAGEAPPDATTVVS